MKMIHGQRGVALILVLGLLLVLLSVGITFVRFVSLQTEYGNPVEDRLKAKMNAESGMALALSKIKDHFENEPMSLVSHDQDWFEWDKEGLFHVRVDDLASYMNVNQAPWGLYAQDVFDYMRKKGDFDRPVTWEQEIFDRRMALSIPFQIRQEWGRFVTNNKATWLNVLNKNVTWVSSRVNYTDQGLPKLNVWSLQDKSITIHHEREFVKLFDNEDEAYQVLANLIDYVDGDESLFQIGMGVGLTLYGDEVRPLINEVRYHTANFVNPARMYSFAHSHGGEFVEIFNPYSEEIKLEGYRLEWESKASGRESVNLPSLILAARSFLLITDHTKRLQFLDHVNVDVIHEVPNFEINRGVVSLVKDNLVSVFDLNLDVDLDQSLIKDDPRSAHADNYSQGFSPGALNENYGQALEASVFADQQRMFVRRKDLSLGRSPLGFLPYVYKGDGPWSFLKVKASDVQDANQNGVLDSNEIEDLIILKQLFFVDEHHQDDYFDVIDGVNQTFKHRQAGRININTSSAFVLASLPGIDRPLAEHIVAYRKQHFSHQKDVKGFQNIYDIILPLKQKLSNEKVDQVFWNLYDLIDVRSHFFHVQVTGVYNNTGYQLNADVEVALDFNQSKLKSKPFPKVLAQQVRRL